MSGCGIIRESCLTFSRLEGDATMGVLVEPRCRQCLTTQRPSVMTTDAHLVGHSPSKIV